MLPRRAGDGHAESGSVRVRHPATLRLLPTIRPERTFQEVILTGFVVGVASSVTAALVVWLFGRYGMPRLRAAAGRGEGDISGKWLTRDDEQGAPVGTALITQNGRRVRLRVTRHTSRHGKPIDRSFTYTGTFRSGQLVARFEDDRAAYLTGAIVLSRSADPDRLHGLATYRDDDEGAVVARPFRLTRQ